MLGAKVTYNGSRERLPHAVIIGEYDGLRLRIFLETQGRGEYDVIPFTVGGPHEPVAHRYRYRFSDPDTAFWFKIEFA